MWRTRKTGGSSRGRGRREPQASMSLGAPADSSIDVPARASRSVRKHALSKVRHGASAALDSLRGAPGEASSAARAAISFGSERIAPMPLVAPGSR